MPDQLVGNDRDPGSVMPADMQSDMPERISNSSSGSSDTDKDSPEKQALSEDDSRSSLAYRPTSLSFGTLQSGMEPIKAASTPNISNISGDIPMGSYDTRRRSADLGSQSRIRMITPAESMFGAESTLGISQEERRIRLRRNLTLIYSCIYAVFLTVTGGVIYVNHQSQETRHVSELFSVCICGIGMVWLLFFHIDLFRYKTKVLKNMMGTTEQIDGVSTCTDLNFAVTFLGNEIPPYRFLTGRHSGSFYLKTGLAAFCFGHLINEGLQLGQQVLNYVQEDRYILGCGETSSIILHTLKPLYSFYQLFIVFKYSNIIINRHKEIARFGLMHIMGTCLCFWFGTIVEDALEDYHHKLAKVNYEKKNSTFFFTSDEALCSHMTNNSKCACTSNAILSVNNVQAIPYLYPFTIEFNLLLAGVWFIVWHNIGKEHLRANPHHFHHKIHKNDGIDEVTFQSNLVISADCHAANKGLFTGLFLLMASIISIIVFFVAMSTEEYYKIGISIHYFQEGTLTFLSLVGILVAYKQLSQLDFNQHPITFLDDVLLFIPLPFYFVQALLTIMSEYQKKSAIRTVMSILVPIQVILQTPFIIDGLRRCSNSRLLRYKKPGREVITFLIVSNLTMWIINTFEAKSVESHYGEDAYFGQFLWMFVSHTTLPLMLFYRFHSSVCLADIWKSAYEKGE